jgi:hypothetical protein
MDERETAIRKISDAMDNVCRDYYRAGYEPKYRAATKATRSIAVEACNEVRNAFDHYTRAFEIAHTIRTDRQSSLAKLSRRLEEASREVERGRRHLSAGAFYCDTHVIAFQIGTIPNMLRTLEKRPPNRRPNLNFSNIWQRLAKLDKRAESLPVPPLYQKNSLVDIMRDIRKIEKLTKRAMRLANDCDRLYETLARHFSKRGLRRIIRQSVIDASRLLIALPKN